MLVNISNGLVHKTIYFVLVAMFFKPNECAARFVSALILSFQKIYNISRLGSYAHINFGDDQKTIIYYLMNSLYLLYIFRYLHLNMNTGELHHNVKGKKCLGKSLSIDNSEKRLNLKILQWENFPFQNHPT